MNARIGAAMDADELHFAAIEALVGDPDGDGVHLPPASSRRVHSEEQPDMGVAVAGAGADLRSDADGEIDGDGGEG